MHWIILAVFLLYSLIILRFSFKWAQINLPNESTDYPSISVIIAARNEEIFIDRAIENLIEQDIDGDQFEIIVVDDHSTDSTVDILKRWESKSELVSFLHNSGEGKKAAILEGVQKARGEWVIVTDADCSSGKGWINTLQNHMINEYHMLFGPIMLKNTSLFSSMQDIEQSALTAIGAVSMEEGYPSMINGANMAFRRDSFLEVGGYSGNEDIPTGDDEFLLRAIHKRYPGSVKFIKDQKCIVTTEPASTLSEFISQRRRWASKWRHHSKVLAAPFVVLFYIFLLGSVVWAILNDPIWLIFIFGSKWLADFILITSVQKFFKRVPGVASFMIGQILYPFYAILIAILANFGTYSWKGRKHSVR